ncbi:hypothetical protein D3C76_1496750 [compost metagenome]
MENDSLKDFRGTQFYVGSVRAGLLARKAVVVSYHTGKQITPPEFARLLVDRYADVLAQELMADAATIPSAAES